MKNLYFVLASSLLISATSMAYATVPLTAMNNKVGQCSIRLDL
jgi:hypothetical protein